MTRQGKVGELQNPKQFQSHYFGAADSDEGHQGSQSEGRHKEIADGFDSDALVSRVESRQSGRTVDCVDFGEHGSPVLEGREGVQVE